MGVFLSVVEKWERGEPVGVLDFIPDDGGGRLLREAKTYWYWTPPGDPKRAEKRPKSNLACLLTQPGVERVLAPLDLVDSKAEFLHMYGLSEELSITFEKFKELVETGRLVITLNRASSHYRADFYKEIFQACERAGYTPFQSYFWIIQFMLTYKLAGLAREEKIPPEKGWEALALKKHPQYDFSKCEEELKDIFEGEEFEIASTDLWGLRVFGFERLTDHALELIRKNKSLGHVLLDAFSHYLTKPCILGLMGCRYYDDVDLSIMAFLRLRSVELLAIAPAFFSLVTEGPAGSSIVYRPDRGDVERFLERGPDEELVNLQGDIQRSAWSYDFTKLIEDYHKLGEVISERYDKELRDWFRRSKIVKGSLYFGIGLTAFTALLTNLPDGLKLLLPLVLGWEKVGKEVERLSNLLVERWPFREKGIPFTLWRYGVKPRKHSKPSRKP